MGLRSLSSVRPEYFIVLYSQFFLLRRETIKGLRDETNETSFSKSEWYLNTSTATPRTVGLVTNVAPP